MSLDFPLLLKYTLKNHLIHLLKTQRECTFVMIMKKRIERLIKIKKRFLE